MLSNLYFSYRYAINIQQLSLRALLLQIFVNLSSQLKVIEMWLLCMIKSFITQNMKITKLEEIKKEGKEIKEEEEG